MVSGSLLYALKCLQNCIKFGSLFFVPSSEGRADSIAETFSFGAGEKVSMVESENARALEVVALDLRARGLNCIYTALRAALGLQDRNGLPHALFKLALLQCL